MTNQFKDLIIAWAGGATIETRAKDSPNRWETLGAPGESMQPGWFPECEYRIKKEQYVMYHAVLPSGERGVYIEGGFVDRRQCVADSPTAQHVLKVTLDPHTFAVIEAVTEPAMIGTVAELMVGSPK